MKGLNTLMVSFSSNMPVYCALCVLSAAIISCTGLTTSESSRTIRASETCRPGVHRSQSELQPWRRRNDLLRPPVSEERLLISVQRRHCIQEGEWNTHPPVLYLRWRLLSSRKSDGDVCWFRTYRIKTFHAHTVQHHLLYVYTRTYDIILSVFSAALLVSWFATFFSPAEIRHEADLRPHVRVD